MDKIKVDLYELNLSLNSNSIDTNWKQVQQTISNDIDYELIFTYESTTAEYSYIVIDDISIINGACGMY
jgi:hypothetical protein